MTHVMVSKSMQRGIVDTDNSRDRITCRENLARGIINTLRQHDDLRARALQIKVAHLLRIKCINDYIK